MHNRKMARRSGGTGFSGGTSGYLRLPLSESRPIALFCLPGSADPARSWNGPSPRSVSLGILAVTLSVLSALRVRAGLALRTRFVLKQCREASRTVGPPEALTRGHLAGHLLSPSGKGQCRGVSPARE
jgi:hypothetical protein